MAGIAANAAALTRYEGWFVIPFVFVYLLLIARKKWHAVLFGVLASLGPLAWLAHNQYYYSNALEFYNGPYSALAIYHRQIAAGMQPYPGDHNWLQAIHYFSAAARLVVGMPFLILGAAGFICAISRRVLWPMIFLALVPAFYVWSMHSSGTPIFVPTLWPFSWYNTRYAIAVFAIRRHLRREPSLLSYRHECVRSRPRRGTGPLGFSIRANPISICWKESAVNSEARREWTQETAKYLAENFKPGSGIAISFGDLAGVLREAGIPIREALHEGNHPEWDATIARPELMLSKAWVVANAGDDLDTAVRKADRPGVHYQLERQIMVKDAPAVEIYRRQP